MELTYISLGAGVQSTTLSLLARDGHLPRPDLAIFADTGWEPPAVYEHLQRLDTEVLQPMGVPLRVVSNGNIRTETVHDAYTNRLPLFLKNDDGTKGTLPRTCTSHYKLSPIYREVRKQLGGKISVTDCGKCGGTGERIPPWQAKAGRHEVMVCSICAGTGKVERVGQPPAGSHATQWIGFSTDEIERVAPSKVSYATSVFPLLDLRMSRDACSRYLEQAGWGSTPKSACIGCPFHGNVMWRQMRDEQPADFADAVAVDHMIRDIPGAPGVHAEGYLHASTLPLDVAPIDHRTAVENAALQLTLFDLEGDFDLEHGSARGCSPYGCRSGDPLDMPDDVEGDPVDLLA